MSVPKSNGIGLLSLGVFITVFITAVVLPLAKHNRTTRECVIARIMWGGVIRLLGVGCIVLGVIILAGGR